MRRDGIGDSLRFSQCVDVYMGWLGFRVEGNLIDFAGRVPVGEQSVDVVALGCAMLMISSLRGRRW